MELAALNDIVGELQNHSATLVAISPQTERHNKKLIDQLRLNFEILFDRDNRFADKIGLKHGFPEDLKAVYGSFGIDLDLYNDNTNWELPIPARFVIDSSGITRRANFNADYTIRPEPEETLAFVKTL